MRVRYLLPIAILAGLAVLFVFGLRHDPREVPSPLIGKPSPDFTLRLLGSDAPYGRAQLLGRPLLVNFFASWCAGCKVEHPFLMELSRRGVEIVGIDYKDTDAAARQWLDAHGNPYATVIADVMGTAGLDWGVYGVPETFVLDAQGTIVYKQIGPMTEEAWKTQIAPLMGGR